MLVMTSGAATVYTSVGIHCRLLVLVAEKLAHNLESPGLRIQQNFRTQVAELMGAQHNSGSLTRVRPDQSCDRP
jgi:hypothetical protein